MNAVRNAASDAVICFRFDLDNTLIDSLAHKGEAVYAAIYFHLAKHLPGLIFDEAFKTRTDLLAQGHPGRAHGWQKLLNLPDSFVTAVYADAHDVMVSNILNACPPDEVIIDGLKSLKDKGHILVLHSHGRKQYCRDILNGAGWSHLFDEKDIYHQERVGHYKTSVKAHQFVQEDLEKQYGNTQHVMVDDLVVNLLAAHYAGAKTVLNGTPLPVDVTQIDFHYPHIHQTLDALNTFTPECLRKYG